VFPGLLGLWVSVYHGYPGYPVYLWILCPKDKPIARPARLLARKGCPDRGILGTGDREGIGPEPGLDPAGFWGPRVSIRVFKILAAAIKHPLAATKNRLHMVVALRKFLEFRNLVACSGCSGHFCKALVRYSLNVATR
jgi:hypothetical protein